jgi:Na+/proline symporter
MLGSGFTALPATLMACMAGNVTVFNTVCTHDIQEPYIQPNQTDQHYMQVGRFATVFGVVFSILSAYLASPSTSGHSWKTELAKSRSEELDDRVFAGTLDQEWLQRVARLT